jgi:hypothetical protein
MAQTRRCGRRSHAGRTWTPKRPRPRFLGPPFERDKVGGAAHQGPSARRALVPRLSAATLSPATLALDSGLGSSRRPRCCARRSPASAASSPRRPTTSATLARILSPGRRYARRRLDRVRKAGVSGIAERLTGELIGTPILRASQVASRHEISHQGAMNALRRLSELDVVVERTTAGRVTFTADAVVHLLSA